MRSFLVILHRWFGLFMAVFLFIAGLTGAIISWDHEIDEWLNPQLFEASTTGAALPALVLADKLEAEAPQAMVTYLPLHHEPGHTAGMSVAPRLNQVTGKPHTLTYNQVALDPVSGAVQGRRMWGAVSLTRENLLPFLYKLHYSMHIPDGWGIELGILFMGIVGIVWVVDCFIALWISFPNLSAWKKSFVFRWQHGGYKLNFDLHRSGGVWVWLLLLTLAVTSVSMNLNFQVVRPLVSQFSTLTPSPFELRKPSPRPIEPLITRAGILKLANQEASRRHWTKPAGAIFYSPEFGVYGVGFFESGHEHGDIGLGNPWLYFDGNTGKAMGAQIPGSGSAGDIFMQAQFPLHSGRIAGLPGRIMVSCLGMMVAMLAVTGVVIWARKKRSRAVLR